MRPNPLIPTRDLRHGASLTARRSSASLAARRPSAAAQQSRRRELGRLRARCGGPEGKLRGRPPPPVEPRSGPWRRTGSESGAGRARTRRSEYERPLPGIANRSAKGVSRAAMLAASFRKRRCAAAFVAGGRHFARELAQRERRMAHAQLGDLAQTRREVAEARRSRASRRTARSCSCAARLVRTRFAWSAFASRFARARVAPMTARSSSASTASPAPASGEHVLDRLARPSRTRRRAGRGRGRRAARPPPPRAARGTPRLRGSALRISRCGARGPVSEPAPSSAPRRYAAPAARARDDTPRRPLERREPRAEDARLVQHLQRPRVARDVELVARRPRRTRAAGTSGSPTRRRTRAAG